MKAQSIIAKIRRDYPEMASAPELDELEAEIGADADEDAAPEGVDSDDFGGAPRLGDNDGEMPSTEPVAPEEEDLDDEKYPLPMLKPRKRAKL